MADNIDNILEQHQLEIAISMYEMFFKVLFEFETREALADYLSEKISDCDKRLIDLTTSQ